MVAHPEPEEVDESDRAAARLALARNWPDLQPPSPKYIALLEALAEFHRRFGADSFTLRYNLRPPKDRTERWTRQLMHGEITEAEFAVRARADAARPIDLEMLTTFHNAYHSNLSHYSGVLQRAAHHQQQAHAGSWQADEEAIDGHILHLTGKLPLWRENLETVFDFLEERRITSGAGLAKLGEVEGTSAHWAAQLLFNRMTDAWGSCKEISRRSQRDPRYLYAARAIDLFCQTWATRFPKPQSLSERLREEFILTRAAIKDGNPVSTRGQATAPESARSVSNLDQSIGNESRELVLLGEMISIVGAAGHIFRATPNSDWGIDGEIEFKDSAGRASGRRVYVQLKSGDSYLVRRADTAEEIFTVRKLRHLEYWVQQAYPVMLVIRQSNGQIRWMDVSAYLRRNGHSKCQILFHGEVVTPDAVRQLAENALR